MESTASGLLFDTSIYQESYRPFDGGDGDSEALDDIDRSLEQIRRLRELAELAKPKKPRRPPGSGYLFEKSVRKNNKEYYQLWFQWEVKGRRYSKYVRAHLEERVKSARNAGATIKEILEILD